MKQGGLLQDIAAVLDSVCGPADGRYRFFAGRCDYCVAVGAEAGSAASYRYTRVELS